MKMVVIICACAVLSVAMSAAIGVSQPVVRPVASVQEYELDTGDVVAFYYNDGAKRECMLHVVQVDGKLHLPFGKFDARGKSIREVRDRLSTERSSAAKEGIHNFEVTVVDLRNADNDHILQNLR